ncbi:hypothetical protein GDO86_007825 [Hymenochirus boettgeri]|uniref:Uncharacterized protein n=1 Tax=Hymenochirus boettgeri TaxID=247094 RepID=A0A8T2IV78_9PIPI|nr:hypothetical protein GDO86_007825 [Hymenochirus boettgeri]
MSSYEVSRFVQKCQKERDEAFRREESARDKLKQLDISTRSHIQELKAKLKEVTSESKSLHRTVKKLRLELGLEENPRFTGKVTKDIIKELQEQEEQCSQLKEENTLISVQLREIIPVLTQTQKQKAEVEKQLEDLEKKMRQLQNENNQVSQLLEDSQKVNNELEKANIMLKKSIEDAKHYTNRSVQTTTSIPVTLQSSYKKIPRDLGNSHSILERRKLSVDRQNCSPTTGGSTHKTYLSSAHS